MIKIKEFWEKLITTLSEKIENFIYKNNIQKEQIISLSYAVHDNLLYCDRALLMYEYKEQ